MLARPLQVNCFDYYDDIRTCMHNREFNPWCSCIKYANTSVDT